MAVGFLSDFGGVLGFGNIGTLIAIAISIVILGIIGGGLWWFIQKKKVWNLKVEFKMPRGLQRLKEGEELDLDEVGGFISSEWGKGSYDAKRGVVWVKRKGLAKAPIKPFNITRYIQGNNILTVVQIGADNYLPVLPESYVRMVDDDTEEEGALLKIRMDTSETRSWRNQFERESKKAYSIMNLLRDYATYIGTGIIIMFNFVGFAMLWSKVA